MSLANSNRKKQRSFSRCSFENNKCIDWKDDRSVWKQTLQTMAQLTLNWSHDHCRREVPETKNGETLNEFFMKGNKTSKESKSQIIFRDDFDDESSNIIMNTQSLDHKKNPKIIVLDNNQSNYDKGDFETSET